METTILRQIKSGEMQKMFHSEQLDIITFQAVSDGVTVSLDCKQYNFEIVIRHNEGTDATEIFNNAYNKMFPTVTVHGVDIELLRQQKEHLANVIEDKFSTHLLHYNEKKALSDILYIINAMLTHSPN